jgi:Cu(I)/Ag(I) efflux system membrane protein CusA/SilA
MINRFIKTCLELPFLVIIVTVIAAVIGGLALRDNPKDAIPDISENQTIVSCDWMGRSPEDVEDQVTYPLSVAMQGIPQVKDVRTISGFGFSRIYVVFEDGVDIYWARSRVVERLAVASANLPEGVVPVLGPDATSLGQIYWYTIEGPQNLAELRSLQDFVIKYSLQNVSGVAEVASIGGFVREYQIEVDPERLRAHSVGIEQIVKAVRSSNIDVGAKTVEQGGLEFLLRGIGFVESTEDLEQIVVKNDDHIPVTLADVGRVQLGPAFRRGALADHNEEKVGGVVTMRYGANPLQVIEGVNTALAELKTALLEGVVIKPFYDRSVLIHETLATLRDTLVQEVLITIVVVLLFLLHLRSALIISVTLPLSVLFGFILMDLFGIGSNIMSLAGIAIAIGSVVDMGIIMTETIYRQLQEQTDDTPRRQVVFQAASEVSGAILTAALTTVLSFLPVFALSGQSYKLFAPLAWTKTFMLLTAAMIAITVVPVLCYLLLGGLDEKKKVSLGAAIGKLRICASISLASLLSYLLIKADPLVVSLLGLHGWLLIPAVFLLSYWIVKRLSSEQLTPIDGNPVARTIVRLYQPTLGYLLRHKAIVLSVFVCLTFSGILVGVGFRTIFAPAYRVIDTLGGDSKRVALFVDMERRFPGFGSEFMPPLDEGSLLYMPSLLSQASLSETMKAMLWQNQQMMTVPEVELAVGKLGRAETALDPAPIGMIETAVTLKPRSEWRPGLTKKQLIADLRQATNIPGIAPSWLQPIETRVIMLSSGIKARIGLEVVGDNPRQLEELALALEPVVKSVEGTSDVTALRTGGKPYVKFHIRRDRLQHYGVSTQQVQSVIEVALGGKALGYTVEGRERYPIRVRYERDLRDSLPELGNILISTSAGGQVPLSDLADFEYTTGPASIRGINGQLVGYVMFNPVNIDETRLIKRVEARVRQAIDNKEINWPGGYSFRWVGQYKEAQAANQRLAFIIPIVLLLILLLIYFHFRRLATTLIVFLGLPLGISGGVLLIHYWPWLNSVLTGAPQGEPIYLTVAVIIGFIALVGIVIDDGVVICTYIQQLFEKRRPTTKEGVQEVVVEAGCRRIRPTLMTTATTLLALLPILWSTGRGSDVMQPMALAVFGGMMMELLTLFVAPTAMCYWLETKTFQQEKE